MVMYVLAEHDRTIPYCTATPWLFSTGAGGQPGRYYRIDSMDIYANPPFLLIDRGLYWKGHKMVYKVSGDEILYPVLHEIYGAWHESLGLSLPKGLKLDDVCISMNAWNGRIGITAERWGSYAGLSDEQLAERFGHPIDKEWDWAKHFVDGIQLVEAAREIHYRSERLGMGPVKSWWTIAYASSKRFLCGFQAYRKWLLGYIEQLKQDPSAAAMKELRGRSIASQKKLFQVD